MHLPILEEEEKQMIGSPQLGSAMTTSLARRRLLFADCLAVRSCPRRVKACLSLLFCLALLVLALYLDIVAVLFLDSLRRHSPERALPLRRPKLPQGNGTMVAEMEFEARSRRMRTALNASFGQLLHGLPARDSFWCDRMVQGQLGTEEAAELAAWKFNETQWRVLPDPKKERPEELPEAGCSALRRLFSFAAEPLSEEERQFPLAYGLLVYKSPMQIFSLLSAIYQPQNAYCLAIDERAGKQFKQEMNLLADCFPNIFAMEIVGPVEWCQFGVVRGVFSCLRHLSEMDHNWRYYQYLSGVDLPLKTNLEMVRIFKQLNGTINAELLPFETSRIPGEQVFMKSPLTLWKSSLSALLSREAVDTIIQSEKVRQLLRYLQFGYCQDEALWGTIAGNPKELFIPGGFDASYLYSRLFVETYLSQIRRKQQQRNIIQHQSTVGYNGGNKNGSNSKQAADEDDLAEPFQLSTYYISRFQVWTDINPLSGSQDPHCKGTFVKASCVFGIGDLPRLVKKPELVAHKLYLDFQPAAYFCLLKSIRERSLDWRNQQKFRGENYGELPTVKMARGEPESELRFFFD